MSFIQEQRKKQIIKSCIDELAGAGYKNLTFKNIARRISINPSLVSYHFKSKNALLFELLDYILTNKTQFIEAGIRKDGDAMQKLSDYIHASLEHQQKFREQNIALIEIIFNVRLDDNKPLYLMEDDEPDGIYYILESILEQGIKKGDINPHTNIHFVVTIINGAVEELLLSKEGPEDRDAFANVLIGMIEQYIK